MEREMNMAPFDENFLKLFLPLYHLLVKFHRYEVKGLENVPPSGRVMMVVNHSFATYDGILLGGTLYLKTGRSPCGLADNNLFKTNVLKKISNKMRMVEANHANAEYLLENGEFLMLAPGGMREALRPTVSESYHVLWQKRKGFAKLSIKTQSPVMLAACPSADRIYDIYPNFLTKFFYKKFKLPLVFAKGWGPSWLPRPVKLTHYLSPPLIPPQVLESDLDYQKQLDDFHFKIVTEMERLMSIELSQRSLPAP